MAIKRRSITVMDCRCGSHNMEGKDFKVRYAINFIDYHMDEYISEAAVASMIREGVTVSVVPFR